MKLNNVIPRYTVNQLMAASFETGPLVVNFSQNRVSFEGKDLVLQPKVLELLVLLCAAKNETLSKQELVDALWPNTYVGPDSLANTMTRLRKTLKDNAKEPKFIETVQRKGYRWLQKVTIIENKSNHLNRIKYFIVILLPITLGLIWIFNSKTETENFPFPSLYIEKLDNNGYEIQVGIDGELTEEKKAAMLKEIKRITGESHSGMDFTLDPIKTACESYKGNARDKEICLEKEKAESEMPSSKKQ